MSDLQLQNLSNSQANNCLSAEETTLIVGGIASQNPYATENDIMRGGVGNDQMNGHNGNDEMYGGDGHDLMFGGSGSDVMYGGAGDDIMYGN